MNKDRKIVKNGFVFIETIIAIIILMVSFLTLFTMYNKIFKKLENRYEYDNLNYIYKANNVKKALDNYSDFKYSYLNLVNDNKLISNIGIESEGLVFNDKKTYMEVLESLQVSNVYIIKDIDTYKKECLQNSQKELCNYISFDNNMKDYIRTINGNNLNYILLIETKIDKHGENCYEECSPIYTFLDIYYLEDPRDNLGDAITNSETIPEIKSEDLWESGLAGDGTRYVGTNPSNYICFGTIDKTECKNNEEKYMYRIIGIFNDNAGNNHLKLIKYKQLRQSYEWNSTTADIDYNNSSLYSGLNGDYFLKNTNYDYLQRSIWLNKIENWDWLYANSKTVSNSGPDFESVVAKDVYLYEHNKNDKINNNGSWNVVNAKVGLYNVSDYLLSLGSVVFTNYSGLNKCNSYEYVPEYECRCETQTKYECYQAWDPSKGGQTEYGDYCDSKPETVCKTCGGYNRCVSRVYSQSGYASNFKTGWMHQSNNDTSISNKEWTITRYGMNSNINEAWLIDNSGSVLHENVTSKYGIRPVFYLKYTVKYQSGIGTYDDPFIIGV